ncbi:hypothetical protein MNQ98_10740 [Paenibacillus sp. N3/727]|uniref:hypothetical protein n=1 Tax=Paenibacillus sp. N3/727 TaxID=2925845 RepID=UPI001F52DD1B|nr:hypothetical protein [Paenibacillus sp. N3/727]UNK20451.1 hypothetical protein MNQ98_10740 [Paenibacillus sp. N3/727]
MNNKLDEIDIEVIITALDFAQNKLSKAFSTESEWLNNKIESIKEKLDDQLKELEHHR